MFLAVRAKAPRMVVLTGSASAALADFERSGDQLERRRALRPRSVEASLAGEGFSTVGVRRAAAGSGRGCAAGEVCAGAGAGAAAVGAGLSGLSGRSSARRGCDSCSATPPLPSPEPGALCDLKYSAHVASTELGSAVYCSYISSSSQSLAPSPPRACWSVMGRARWPRSPSS